MNAATGLPDAKIDADLLNRSIFSLLTATSRNIFYLDFHGVDTRCVEVAVACKTADHLALQVHR